MNDKLWDDVDRYISDIFSLSDPILKEVLRASADAGLPAIQVTPSQGKFLQILAGAMKARRILEIGTLGAFSTIWLGRALAPDGYLITLESDPKHAEVARANIARAGLADRVELILGPALETLPRLQNEKKGPFDFIFIDADKTSYPEYFEWSLKLAHPGTVMVADNVIRKGEVANPKSDDPRVVAVRRFHDLIAAEKRVTATALQTVGSKGYDGFTMVLVEEGP
ncbi:conserved hypothetical protein [Candidatus Zixiibacteriota bacterium]|nr:conserved hypothetical protein [candidate division Zixibacteria bacterium]